MLFVAETEGSVSAAIVLWTCLVPLKSGTNVE